MCKITAAVLSYTATKGSDGSLKDSEMSLEWAIETKEGYFCRLVGAGILYVDPTTKHSIRAKRGRHIAILAVMCYVGRKFFHSVDGM